MSKSAASVVWQPFSIALPEGRTIAGLCDPAGAASFTLLLLHERSRDLDQCAGLLGHLPFGQMRRLALDLPGCGLSDDPRDERDAETMLHAFLDIISDDMQHPLVIVALGDTAPLAWRLASHPAVVGLGLVSPFAEEAVLPRLPPRLSLIGFVAHEDKQGIADWGRLRRSAGCRWLEVSMAVTRAELLDPTGSVKSQVASHLSGFARDAFSIAKLTHPGWKRNLR